ncbi:DNA cytosine methyltransferase, partial [Clostridium sp. ATCC 25772]
MGITVLSLFDGISCGMVALERAGINVKEYYSSEIDKSAIGISNKNYPNIKRLGDINNINIENIKNMEKIDLLLAGSPCQGFSRQGKGLNFEDPRSKLFFKFVDI